MDAIVQFVQTVFNAVNGVDAGTWKGLLAFLGGSTAAAGVLQVIKHKLNIADAKKLLAFLLVVLSFVGVFADFVLQYLSGHPTPQLGKLTVEIIGAATVLHRFAISPAYYWLVAKIKQLDAWLADVKQVQAAKKTETPIAPTPVLPANLQQFEV